MKDCTIIKNYRPITVLNTDYRLYTSILCARLLRVLGPVVRAHQLAFLPGRLIDDNIRLVQALIDTYKEGAENYHILFLDQVKAYDRVFHEYLWACMQGLGMPRDFIRGIKMLTSEAEIVLNINGHISDRLIMHCDVRQGDPMSCPIYLIAIEPLLNCFGACPSISGVGVPRGGAVKAGTFADDMFMPYKNMPEIHQIQEVLRSYERASGSKVNWDKSVSMQVGQGTV